MPGVTKEQIQAAREADLFAYLQFHEPGVLKRDGPNYRHKEHDSLVYVTGKRYWYWNSRGRSINALDYLIQIRGYGLVDAVHTLVGGEIQQAPAYRSATEKAHVQKEPEKKPFSLPWVRRCATSAVSYLQRRGISSDVIGRCFRKGLFYEARYHGEPVCVFVAKPSESGSDTSPWRLSWKDDGAYTTWLTAMAERSVVETDVTVTSSDKVLTLSTCTPGGASRFIVMAKLVEVNN